MLTVLRKNLTRTENLAKIVHLGEKSKWFTEGYKQSKYSVVLKCFFNLSHVKRHKKYTKIIFFMIFRINLGLVLLRDFRKPYFDHISILVIQNWTTSNTAVLRKTIFLLILKITNICVLFLQKPNMFVNFLVHRVAHETLNFRKIQQTTYFSENSGFLWFFVENEDKLRIPKVRYQWQSVLKTVKPYQKWYGFQFPTEKS